jgi:hypothetical protein
MGECLEAEPIDPHEASQTGKPEGALCPVCTLRHGLTYAPIVFKDRERFFQHLETAHHMPVPRAGESEGQAVRRFLEENPEALDCSQCKAAGASWAAPEEPH